MDRVQRAPRRQLEERRLILEPISTGRRAFMRLFFREFRECHSGSVPLEYALIGSMVSVLIVYSLNNLNEEMIDMFEFLAEKFASRAEK
jgi:Flp pilus assembly pilin Flp